MEKLKRDLNQGNSTNKHFLDLHVHFPSRAADMQLVDLFSPEFNLKIGDIFSKSGGQSKVLSETQLESDSEKLRRIVTERMETDTIQ